MDESPRTLFKGIGRLGSRSVVNPTVTWRFAMHNAWNVMGHRMLVGNLSLSIEVR